jgi:hypothetical protein
MKHKYEVIVGNVGTMEYTNKKEATKIYKDYVRLSKAVETRAAGEPVTLLKDGKIIEEYTPQSPNLIKAMFNIDVVKANIAKCPKDEIVILCPHWSINKPKYDEIADPETEDWDFSDFEKELDTSLYVNDYDDLIADPHGIYNS